MKLVTKDNIESWAKTTFSKAALPYLIGLYLHLSAEDFYGFVFLVHALPYAKGRSPVDIWDDFCPYAINKYSSPTLIWQDLPLFFRFFFSFLP